MVGPFLFFSGVTNCIDFCFKHVSNYLPHNTFTDFIEIVPDLVWVRSSKKHPANSLAPENIFDQNDTILETFDDIFPTPDIPSINPNLKNHRKNLKILKKHLTHPHILPFIVPGDPPSVIWTTVVVSIIHLLFEFFR